MRYEVCKFDYGCEGSSILSALQECFPKVNWDIEFDNNYCVYASGDFDALTLNAMSQFSETILEVFRKGYSIGVKDTARVG